MNEALTYLYQIYAGFVNLVFNTFEISNGVSIGWILVSVTVFGILINTILNIPKSGSRINIGGNKKHGR